MAVIIESVIKKSPACKARLKAGYTLLSVNGHEITDVLDYRFYQNDTKLTLEFITDKGKIKSKTVKKDEYEELGLEFETYLMDKKQRCKNKCIFCFIDQLPGGMRESLYFKDDDSRLSFLFGNYITLTGVTEREVERIIKMHISPINISVHTTNPELRVKMMGNRFAGESLGIIRRLNKAGIKMNCQLVLCPGYNDGKELERSLNDLLEYENVECIASVPVGITDHRQGLAKLEPFNRETAEKTLDIIEKYGELSVQKYGERRVYAADEFYLLSGRKIPDAKFYGDFLQLENGVGMWALLLKESLDALSDIKPCEKSRKITAVTGVAAYPLICEIAKECESRIKGLECSVKKIENNYFGNKITVSGLITATDIYDQLKDTVSGGEILIPSSMLRSEKDMFLDSVTVEELSKKLNAKITVTDCDGYSLVESIIG